MTKRGLYAHFSFFEKVDELAKQNHTSPNQMMVSLIEVGMPLFKKIKQQAPTIAREITRRRYTFEMRKKAQEMIEGHATKEAEGVRFTERLTIGLTEKGKLAIKGEAFRTHSYMTEIARRKLGVI